MSDEKQPQDLRERTKKFALRVIRMCGTLPNTREVIILGDQIFRSSTSVGANYREAYRARSKAEFISKIVDSQRELEETIYWMELISEVGLVSPEKLALLQAEADELMAISSSVIKNSRRINTVS